MPWSAGTIPEARQWKFEQVAHALRQLQDAVAAVALPEGMDAEVAREIEQIVDKLSPHVAGERTQLFGACSDIPGRGQTMTPRIVIDSLTDTTLSARVTLGRFYLGFNGAAHGGVIPLIMDEALSKVANIGRKRARTAHLEVDFRSVAPIGSELHVHAQLASVDGRKRWVTGQIRADGHVCAEARALFVELRPDQT